VVGELVVQLDRETEDTENNVRDNKTHDEAVGRRMQTTIPHEGVDDDAVATDTKHYDDDVQQHDGHLEPHHTTVSRSTTQTADQQEQLSKHGSVAAYGTRAVGPYYHFRQT